MAKAQWRGLVVGLSLGVVVIGVGIDAWAGGYRSTSPLDGSFARLRVGMSAAEVEAILGPGRGPDPEADQVIVREFDDVDAPPIALALSAPSYWYDGRRRRVRAYYKDGRLWQAKLNGPGRAGRYLQ